MSLDFSSDGWPSGTSFCSIRWSSVCRRSTFIPQHSLVTFRCSNSVELHRGETGFHQRRMTQKSINLCRIFSAFGETFTTFEPNLQICQGEMSKYHTHNPPHVRHLIHSRNSQSEIRSVIALDENENTLQLLFSRSSANHAHLSLPHS